MSTLPSIEAIQVLDGKIYAMLTPDEEQTLNFFIGQGRKFGVSVAIINEADPAALANARSKEEAEHILKSANSRIRVTVGDFFQVQRRDEAGEWQDMAATGDPRKAAELLTDSHRRVVDRFSGKELSRANLLSMTPLDEYYKACPAGELSSLSSTQKQLPGETS